MNATELQTHQLQQERIAKWRNKELVAIASAEQKPAESVKV